MLKPLTVWITTNCGKFIEMRIPDHLTCLLRNLYAGQEATVRTRHATMDWFQIGKGVGQDCIFSPCLFNLYAECVCMLSCSVMSDSWQPHGLQTARLLTACKMPGWMTHKLDSKFPGEISATSDMQMIPI